MAKWFDRDEKNNPIGVIFLCFVFYNFLAVTISPLSVVDKSKNNLDLETYPTSKAIDAKLTNSSGYKAQKSKVEVLGSNLKRHVARLRRIPNKKVELVFLVDSSSSVGAEDFFNELKFVKKLLADFTVSVDATRVAVITFSSKRNVVKHVDHLTKPSAENHKCKLLEDQLARINYVGGGTYTLGAVLQAQEVLKFARPNSTKAVFLVTDGYSNAGDPIPAAKKLKEQGVEIFTFGIRFGNVQELTEMASDPSEEHTYILESFEEFEALARRALHEDLQIGGYLSQPESSCYRLCTKGINCCDQKASCTCGTHTGHYACLCPPGFYGTGTEGDCIACPEGTYKEAPESGDAASCKRCPNINHYSPSGSSSAESCRCKAGYRTPLNSNENSCEAVHCPPLSPPEHGFFVNGDCETVFNAACGIGCEPGFRLVGNSIRLCTENGTWTGEITKCEMKTCPVLHAPRFGKMICNDDKPMYDVECTFSCLPGYSLVGSVNRICLPIGLWNGLGVFCRSVTCSPLIEPKHGYLTPNKCARKKVSYGDICQYSCEPGYVISGPKQTKCGDSGIWTNKGNKTRCIDKQPPRLTCPKDIVVNAEEAQMYIGASVNWKLPEVTDNSGEDPSLMVVPAVFPPRVFLIGSNTITYIAEDKNFNKAECSFKITVRDTYPPTIDLCESPPAVYTRSVPVKITWPDPAFSDNSGDPVVVTAPFIPKEGFRYGETKIRYEARDKTGNINTCVISVVVQEHACTYPPEPVNGVMNCTENTSQVSCTLICLPGFAFVEPPKAVYHCAYDGIWHPTDVFPDCSETELSNSVVQIGLVSLTTNKTEGSCSDYFLLDQLQKHYKRKIFQKINGVCSNEVECTIEKALLTCNQNRERKEEETNFISRRRRTQGHKSKRSAGDESSAQNIILEFELAGTMERNSQDLLLSNVKKVMDTLETAADNGDLDLIMGSNYFRIESIHFPGREPKFRCDQGSMPLNKSCVKCPIGTFFSVISEECEACGLGTYQFQEGQVSCLVCPEKTSTSKGQSKSVGECKAQCLPGSYSLTGLEVCQTCAQGFYQPLYAQTSCIDCPGSLTTWRRGTRHLKDCQEICHSGEVSRTGLRPCFACPDGYYQPGRGRKVCFRCPNGVPTNKRGANALEDCKDYTDEAAAFSHLEILPVNDCFSVPCLHGSTCEAQEFGYVCHCKSGYKGIHCDVDIDECSSQPCFNNATCKDLVNGFKCVCSSGFIGPTCQTEIDECMSRPCQNGATCVDKINGFNCKCLPGYAGIYCEVDINDCLSKPCQNGGTCVDKVADYACECMGGYTGINCEINIDDCASNPCQHNATCIDGVQTFRCDCLPGFEGDLCQSDINECQSHPCLNGATCHNIVAGFICQCPPAFSGQLCETEMSSEFLVDFKATGTLDFIKINKLRKSLNEFSLCLWLNTTDRSNYGTPFSYATDEHDNALTLTDYNGFVLYVNAKRVVSDITANEGQWRHVCVVWKSRDGSWSVYKDGHESDKGIDLATGTSISDDGTLILGQEQDKRGSSFSAQESFVGTLSMVNLWSRTLSMDEISRMVTHCDKYSGDVLAWPDFLPGIRGQLTADPSQFCHECTSVLSIGNGTVFVSGNKPGGNASYVCDGGFELTGMAKRVCTIFGSWSGNAPKCSKISCGYPPSLTNGRYTGWKYLYKDTVEYNCSSGFRLVGSSNRSCQADKSWSNEQPICEEILCEPFLNPTHGKITNELKDGRYKPGNKLNITCQEGYRLDGETVITCLETGLWSASLPICQPKSCQMPPTVPHSAVLGKKNNFKVRDWVKYSCNPGYKLLGNDTIQCGIKSQWVGGVPKCEKKPCGKPPKSAHASETDFILYFGEIANYHCHVGYDQTDGDSQLECMANQTWGGRLIKCTPVNCPLLVPPLHGSINPDNNRTLHSLVSYSCDSGYQLGGVSNRKCLSNAEWSGDEPMCNPVLCGPPKPIPNGRFTGDDFTVGNTVIYSCNTGYKILGVDKISCGKNGLWIRDAPICEPVNCPEPRDPKQGIVIFAGSFFGQRAEYRCLNGYELVGATSSVCRENGKWDPLAPICRPISCGPLPKIESAVVNASGTDFGSIANYVCQLGFRMRHPKETVLNCLENGTWSQPFPLCDIVRCPIPLPIRHGNPVFSDTTYESTVEYYCNKGYRLEGSVQRTCQNSGKWSSEKPQCKIVECPALAPPSHGVLSVSHFQYDSEAFYTCDPGHEIYEQSGQMIGDTYERKCQDDGSWTGLQPECKPVQCDGAILNLEYGRVTGTEYTFGSIVQYYCNVGYKLIGLQNRRCLANKNWEGEAPFCEIVQCPEPYSVLSGNIVGSSRRIFGETVEYSCDKGHQLKGEKALSCRDDGNWDNPPPICVKVNCSQPNIVENGLAYVKSLSYGSYIRYQCSRGYNLQGPEERQCDENAQWSLNEPFCQRIFCPNLPKISNSKTNKGVLYSGSQIFIECQKGYIVVPEDSVLKCDDNGNWRGEVPRCEKIQCPVPGEIKYGGFNSSNGEFSFGSRVVFFCNKGWDLLGEESIECDGEGRWTAGFPVCIGTKCPALYKVDNSEVNSTETKYGTTVYFKCLTGHVLSGNEKLTCQIDNTWSGIEPRCYPVNCTRLVDISKGKCFAQSTTYGSKLICNCDEGYQLHGSSVLTCTVNGQWSADDPVCTRISCPIPGKLKNGIVYVTRVMVTNETSTSVIHPASGKKISSRSLIKPTGLRRGDITVDRNLILSESGYEAFLFKDELSYECDDGYYLIGVPFRLCGSEGRWSNEDPACNVVICETPSTPINGFVTFRAPPVFGTEAVYNCTIGYEILGSAARRCLSNGSWSEEAPICSVIKCERPEPILNGNIKFKALSYASVAVYSCEENYKLEGLMLRTCSENKSWSGDSPFCTLIECPHLPPVGNGLPSYQSRVVRTQATVICNKGYEMPKEVPSSVECLFSGLWSESLPDCIPITCPSVFTLQNGSLSISSSDTRYNTTVNYKCHEGFVLVGSATRTCQENRSWSGSTPLCEPVRCRLLTVPTHGKLMVNAITYGSYAKFICNTGYTLVGSNTTLCQANGRWTNPPPKCQIIACSSLPKLKNGQTVGNSNIYKSVLSFQCHQLYRLVGPQKIECLLTGQWSGLVPQCQRHICDNLPYIKNSKTKVRKFEINSNVEIECQSGYRIRGNGSLYCDEDGDWISRGIRPSCELITCNRPREIPNGSHNGSQSGKDFILGSRIQYECDPGFALVGTNQSVCQANGQWNTESVNCKKICNDPPGIQNGQGHVEEHIDGTSEVIYSCFQGFKLVGNERDICGKEKPHWFENTTWCVRIACGQLASVSMATIALSDSFVGSVANYICREGYYLVGNGSLTCSETGDWVGYIPKCEPIPCQSPKAPENGFFIIKEYHLSTSTQNSSQQLATYNCAKGHVLVGDQILQCKEGKWLGQIPHCKPISCGKPKPDSHSITILGSVYDFGKRLLIRCPPGTILVGHSSIICQVNGSWSQQPKCQESCNPPCQDGQLCVHGSCSCQQGFTGPKCSSPICILPCLHGGWCIAPYKCECPPQYEGDRCHILKSGSNLHKKVRIRKRLHKF